MSDQDQTKSGKMAPSPGQEIPKKTEKDASSLTEDELSKISGGSKKPDQY